LLLFITTIIVTAQDFNIPIIIQDGAYDGSLDSMASISLFVPDSCSISDIDLVVGIDQHTFIGDLTMKLQSPGKTVVTLLVDRAGLVSPDDGTDCQGTYC
jgi:subtilisin-like proprotein convertase family protein